MLESVIMFVTILSVGLIIALANASGHGNIYLLEEEIADALKICAESDTGIGSSRPKREDGQIKIDSGSNTSNMDSGYEHTHRDTIEERLNVQNDTGTANDSVVMVTARERLDNSAPEQINKQRMKRSDQLTSSTGDDECLSQCVFANMQVVDARGIPREPELWSRVQTSVTSQQSRSALRGQLRACFQELQSEDEDDGCSYSNKLERCLTLRLSDRNNSTVVLDKKP